MKKILILLAFLFVVAGANALTLSENSAETCATDTSIFIFTVNNAENFENSYTVSFSDSAGKWAIAAPAGFNLKPGQSQSVYVYVTPSISASPGQYPLKITLSSLAGTESAEATIIVKDCHSASLTTNASTSDICSATEAVYPLTLKNTGKYTENFALSISGVPAKWTTLSEELVKLGAGQAKNIIVHSTPPADQTGNFALTITAASQNSRAMASADLDLVSKGCYDFSAAADTNYLSFCENSEAKIPLTLENKGSVDNSYSLSVEGPAWSTIENKNIDVPAQQARFTNVVLFPSYGVAGDFKVKVTVSPKIGDEQSQTILANIRSCHEASVKISSVEDTICPHTSKAYAVSVVNNGEFAEKYSLTAVGADFASIDKDFVELEAGNSTEFNLVVEPKDASAGTKTIVVRAEAQGTSHAAATSELKLNIAPMSACYGVQATAAITKVHVATGEPAVVPIILENKGLENSTYNLDVSGTGAQFVQLNPASVELNGKTAKTIYAYVAVPEQTAEQTYKVTVSARLADGTISSATTFDILLGAAEEQPAATPLTAGTPKERLAAVKDRIVAFFSSIGARITSIQMPKIGMPKLSIPQISLPKLGSEKEEAVNETNETEGNVTEEENQTQEIVPEENQTEGWNTNETVFPAENKTVEENITITEEQNIIEEQNQTQELPPVENKTAENLTQEIAPTEENLSEELPENVSQFLSPELAAKLSGENKTENKTEETTEGTGAKATGLAALKEEVSNIKMPAINLGVITTFLMEKTYYDIPNWLFIICVIIIIAAFSYIIRKKNLGKKFNDFLEDDAAAEIKPEETKEENKPAAQDILDEVEKEEKKEKPKRKARKK